jgi:hypothetical protein
MPTPQQFAENRLDTLDRLCSGDRIVWQNRDGECNPEAVWWEHRLQLGHPWLWLSTCKLVLRRGHIIDGLRPKDSFYRGYTHVRVLVLTPAGEAEFIRLERATLSA